MVDGEFVVYMISFCVPLWIVLTVICIPLYWLLMGDWWVGIIMSSVYVGTPFIFSIITGPKT